MKVERWFWIAVAIILASLATCQYIKKAVVCPEIVGSITRIDIIKGRSDTIYKPVPYSVTTFKPVPYETIRIDTFEHYTGSASDYADPCPPVVLSKYRDTLKLDSSGTVIVNDEVNGTIEKRSFTYNIFRPTITNTVEARKRNAFYYGVEAIGNKYTLVSYLGLNLSMQPKNSDKIFTIGAGYMNKQVQYKAGVMFKIKLHR